jgi:hypothetical protein
MKKSIRDRFETFKKMPFPKLGKTVGDFPLYDSLLAGTVASFLDGAKLDLASIPAPDAETEETVRALRRKSRLSVQEAEFVKYVDFLEQLRVEITKAIRPRSARVS